MAVPSHPTLLHLSLVRWPQGHHRGTSRNPPEPSALSSVGFPFLREEPRAARQQHSVWGEEGRAGWEPLRRCWERSEGGSELCTPHGSAQARAARIFSAVVTRHRRYLSILGSVWL